MPLDIIVDSKAKIGLLLLIASFTCLDKVNFIFKDTYIERTKKKKRCMSKEIILKEIDFKSVGAPTRSVIGKDSNNHLYIIKNIKSRIIMKDGRKIVETVKQIKNKTNSSVSLATTAPVCSKTKRFLNENDIRIIYDYIIK